jgi:hypothetical protein
MFASSSPLNHNKMEEKQNSLGIHTMIYGLITGVALIVFTLIMYVANLYLNTTIGYLAFLISIGGMVYGALQYRKNQLKGFMTYGQAFSSTFLIGLFATIVSTVFFFFYVKYINTGMINELLDQIRVKMEAKSGTMTPEQMEQAMAWTAKFMTPVWMVIWGFLGNLFWGALFSLVIAIFLKKKDPEAPVMV